MVEPGYKIWRHIPKLYPVKSYQNSYKGKANYRSEKLPLFDFFITTLKKLFPQIAMGGPVSKLKWKHTYLNIFSLPEDAIRGKTVLLFFYFEWYLISRRVLYHLNIQSRVFVMRFKMYSCSKWNLVWMKVKRGQPSLVGSYYLTIWFIILKPASSVSKDIH